MIFLLGMLGVQYTLMYNAKSNLTYASYEAARAGAIHNADPNKIQEGLLKGLLPYLSANGNGVLKKQITCWLIRSTMSRSLKSKVD